MIKKILSFTLIMLPFLTAGLAGAAEPLFANLVKGADGKYTITEVTNSADKINLLTLEPVGFNSSVIDCTRAFFGAVQFNDNGDKCSEKGEFRTKTIRFGPTVLLGITTMGLSLVAGIVKIESVFDTKAYDRAVKEALKSTGLDKSRGRLIQQYSRIYSLSENYNRDLKELFRIYSEEYRGANPQITDKKIVDLSGYYNEDDLLVDALVRIDKKTLSGMEAAKFSVSNFTATPAGLEEKLTEIEKTLPASFKEYRESYEKGFKSATVDYGVVCGPEYLKPYHIRYECPKTISASASGTEHKARAIIISKDFEEVFPLPFIAENEDLKVTFNKNDLLFENRQSQPVKILSISLSYNGKTSVISFAPDEKRAHITPRAQSNVVASTKKLINNEITKAAAFKDVTKEVANKTRVSFGLSIKYSVGEKEPGALYSLKEFTLAELL